MKKSIFNLGSVFLVVVFFFTSLNSYTQDIKLSKQERKAAKETLKAEQFMYLNTLLESKSFVLEADFLQNQYGDRINVTPLLNFIQVNKSDIVLQTGTNVNRGYNGVGGVTAQGTMSSFKIVKNLKSYSYLLKFTVLSNIGTYYVSMNISSDNRARAEITGLNRGKLIYNGRLVALNDSRIFKGWNSI